MAESKSYLQFLAEIWLTIQPGLRHLFLQFLVEQQKMLGRQINACEESGAKHKGLIQLHYIENIRERWLSEFLDEVATSAFGVDDLAAPELDESTRQKVQLYDQVIKASHQPRLERMRKLQLPQLEQLKVHLQAMALPEPDLQEFPLAPKPLLRCFLASLDAVDIPNECRTFMFDCFETEVLSHTSSLYAQLQQFSPGSHNPSVQIWDQAEALQGVVTLVFDYILDNSAVHPKLQQQVRRLEAPLVDSVRTDKSFLTRKQHPARKLIKDVCELCARHDPERDDDGELFYQAFVQIIDELLDAYKGNASVFIDARSSLRAYVQKNFAKLYPSLQPGTETQLGSGHAASSVSNIELNQYETYVCAIINRVFESYELSQGVSQFLIESWCWVMNTLLEREGPEGRNFLWSLRVLQDTANIFHRDYSGVTAITAETQFNQLMQDIQFGFKMVAFSQARRTKILQLLEQEYLVLNTNEAPVLLTGY